jgi:hypothetical protein
MPSNGQGSAKRLTFDGNYNARGISKPFEK